MTKSIFSKLDLSKMGVPPSASSRWSNPLVRLRCAGMYAMTPPAAAPEEPGCQSNSRRASVRPSHTCISWYSWMRPLSICFHAPMLSRYRTDEGVKELQRVEYWSGGSFHSRVLERSWASTKATLRREVAGFDPSAVDGQLMDWTDRPRAIWARSYVRRAASRLSPAGPPPTHTTT